MRLAPRSGDPAITVVTVHLKARPSGGGIRRTQWAHLAAFVGRLQEDGDRVVVLGDFNVTGGTGPTDGPAAEADALARRLAHRGLAPVEVGPCTAYWQGVRYDDWLEPTRLDLAFVAGFGTARPPAGVGAHCRRHNCTAFSSSRRAPDPAVQSMSDHCPVFVDLPRR